MSALSKRKRTIASLSTFLSSDEHLVFAVWDRNSRTSRSHLLWVTIFFLSIHVDRDNRPIACPVHGRW